MKIAVCVKQVPDTTELRLDPETNTLIREGVAAVLNPLDEFPIEAALRLRESAGGTVSVVTMGPPQAEEALLRAMAMGADECILVSDTTFAGSDTWATSLTLARALHRTGPFDIILCGKQAIDGDTAQVGPGIAAHLDIPQITYVTGIHVQDDALRVERLLDTGHAVLAVRPPVVLTVLKEANEPRLPTLGGRLRSLDAVVRQVDAADIDVPPDELGLSGSPTRVVRITVPRTDRSHTRLEGAPADQVAALLDLGILP